MSKSINLKQESDNFTVLYILAILFFTYTMFFNVKENLADVTTNFSIGKTNVETDLLNQDTKVNVTDLTTSSTQSTDTANVVRQQLNQKKVNNAILGCINNIKQDNIMNIIGSNVTDSSLTQENDFMADCLSEFGVTSTSASDAENTTDTKASTGGDVSASTTVKNVTDQTSASENIAKATATSSFDNTAIIWIVALLCIPCISSIVSSMMGMFSGGGSGSIGPEGADFSTPGGGSLSIGKGGINLSRPGI